MASNQAIRDAVGILAALGVSDSEQAIMSWTAAMKPYNDNEVIAAARQYARTGEKKPLPKYIVAIIHDSRNNKSLRIDASAVHDIMQAGDNMRLHHGVIMRMVNLYTGKIPWDGIERHHVAGVIAYMELHKDDWGEVFRDEQRREWSEFYGPNWERLLPSSFNMAGLDNPDLEPISDTLGRM